jgi:integrase
MLDQLDRQVPRLQLVRAVDRRGFYRSPITVPGYRIGKEPGNKGRTFPPEPLTQREALALLNACGKGNAGLRNRALIVVMWRGLLRCQEALDLYPKDLNLDEGAIRVLHAKGDKANDPRNRTVGLDPMACAIVARWMEARGKLGLTGRQPVFCVISKPTLGSSLHSQYVRGMLKAAGKRAGIEKRCHPHGLRHTGASELADEQADLRLIQAQLGHTNPAVTYRYINHLNPRALMELMRARQWPDPDPAGAPPS